MKNLVRTNSSFPYSAVLWDIDGTLADSEPIHLQSIKDACAELSVSLPDGFHNNLIGKTDKETYSWLRNERHLGLAFRDWVNLRVAHYLRRIDEVRPHPDALKLWHGLEKLGVAQATVSNSDRVIVQCNLERLRINRPGFVSIALNDVQNGKPDPEPYIRAASLLGVEPYKCAVVEDSSTGGAAAVAAGMDLFLMPWSQEAENLPFHKFDVLASFAKHNYAK